MKYLMCDSSDFKKENGYYVCQICGNKIPIQSKTDDKQKNHRGLTLFGMGLVLLLGIIIVGLAVYGRVYFFDGYFITKLLTICCIIWMVGGFIEFLVGLIMKFSKK